LATHRELDYKISLLGVTLHLEPIAIVRDPEHQVRPAPWPRRHRIPHDAQIELAWLLAPRLLDRFNEPVGWRVAQHVQIHVTLAGLVVAQRQRPGDDHRRVRKDARAGRCQPIQEHPKK
jgi:hypothetical protein